MINLVKINYMINNLDRRLILLFMGLFFIYLKTYLAYPSIGIIKDVGRDLVLIIIIWYYVVSLVRNERDIVFFQNTIIFVGSTSMSVAILQFLNVDFAWELRKFIDFSDDPADIISAQISARDRPPGLAYFSITYSYQMLIVASMFFGKYATNPSFKNHFLLLFGVFGIFVCMSRSALLGVLISFIIFYLFNKFSATKLLAMVGLAMSIFIGLLFQETRDFGSSNDSVRYYLFLAGLNVAIDYAITGIGSLDPAILTSQYMETYPVPSWAIPHSVHNSFLTPLMTYGPIMLIPIFYLYYIYFVTIKKIEFDRSELYCFFYVYIISYSIHSLFHNAGFFNKDQLFWLILSFLLAVRNIRTNNFFKRE